MVSILIIMLVNINIFLISSTVNGFFFRNMVEKIRINNVEKINGKYETNFKRNYLPWILSESNFFKKISGSFLLGVICKKFIAQSFRISSESMHPTLHINDIIIVEKLSKFCFPFKRGDVVLFSCPNIAQKISDSNAPLIKRIIGLEGDYIRIRKGNLFINGIEIKESNCISRNPFDFEIIIPPNEAFVLGDNRENSFDSRSWGSIPMRSIIGKPVFCFWPISRLGWISNSR